MYKLYVAKLKQLTAGLAAIAASAGIASASLMTPAIAAPVTSFFDLGTLGGSVSEGFAINDSGKVAGRSLNASNINRAFVWDSTNGMVDLGTLGGSTAESKDINNNDVVVGVAATATVQQHAFISQSGTMTDINPAGFTSSIATSVNDSSQVVGYGQSGTLQTAFFWSSSTGFVTIAFGGQCRANAINNNGIVTGVCDSGVFVWDSSTQAINNLGWFGGGVNSAEAFGINSQGQIVGQVRDTADGSGVFMWDPITGQVDLTSLKDAQGVASSSTSNAYGINDSSEIIGSYVAPAAMECTTNIRHAYVWSQADGFTDVGQDGITTQGLSINNASQIAGSANPYVCPGTDPAETSAATSSALRTPILLAASSTNANIKHASKWDAKIGPSKIFVGDAAISRGNDAKTRTIQFPVTLSEPATTTVTVNYSVEADGSGTAQPITDFKKKTGTVTFKPSATTGRTKTTMLVAATVVPRGGVSASQTFRIVLSEPAGGYEIGKGTGTATILPPSTTNTTVSVGDASVAEGDHGKNTAKVWVTLSQPATSTQTVQISFSNGTATGKSDYKPLATKTVSFSAGQWQKAVALTTLTDMVTESDETINITLSSPSAGLSLGRTNGAITILNDD